ncbi:YeeE YedE family protein [Companilactobacillus nodensis DSM 19682 = JCM 14932 = NBRC 107160]|uniref:YeeE YedE family protein n=1 Tax=Companilactobacillus nodensis DSM 19682 = JCM 14932 = NBRC 107160 TaxID=1423775 RepID=A0A0R1KJH1_9LACO|nr:YeeE YedE family protein [Companilactobacillus nodensis DSM 19682 = JCM 14932 = NBRC 107160]
MPDWFKWDGLNGYLGAIVLTAIFAGIGVYLSYLYEKKRRNESTYSGVLSERMQDKPLSDEGIADYSLTSPTNYDVMFKRPLTLKQGAIGLAFLFVLLMGLTKSGWGASTPYGFWFGKVLTSFGVSAGSLASFTNQPAAVFAGPWLANGVTVQNFGILLGTLVYFTTAGLMSETIHSVPSLTVKSSTLYAIGGFSMGFGTRLSNGCNVGALYSPIATFSLSGWIFLIVLVAGGIIGNMVAKRVYA